MKTYNIKLFRKLLEYEMSQLDDHSYVRNVCLNSINENLNNDESVNLDDLLNAFNAYRQNYSLDSSTCFDGPLVGALKLYDDFANHQKQMIKEEMADDPNYNVIKMDKGGDKNG